ncbi:hypothetical protein BH20VER2_BH20VER2_15890 [soil metagenome]
MNEFSELEAELKQLRPVAPAVELTQRIEQELETAPASATPTAGVLPRPAQSRVSWFTLGLGVAAAAALFLLARVAVDNAAPGEQMVAALTPAPLTTAASQPATSFVPEGLTRVVYNQRDEGLVFPEGEAEPLRRVRSRTRETLAWRNPETGASLRVSYPAEEVRFIPVSGQ